MRKPFRIALVLATAAVVIVLYAAASLLRSLDTPEFKARVAREASAVVGARVQLDSLNVSLLRGIRLGGVRVQNPPGWNGNLLSAETARLSYSPWSLLRGRIVVDELTVRKPVVTLQSDARGVFNYQRLSAQTSARAAAPAPASAGLLSLVVSKLSVEGARLAITDQKNAAILRLDEGSLVSALGMDSGVLSGTGEARIESVVLTNALFLRGVRAPIKLTRERLSLAPLQATLAGGAVKGDIAVGFKPDLRYTLKVAVTGASVATLLKEAGSAGTLTGALDSQATIRGAGGLLTLEGEGQAEIKDCRWPKSSLFSLLADVLKLPELKDPRFDECRVQFVIAGGQARTPVVAFKGPALELTGEGATSLQTTALDYDLTLALSPGLLARVPAPMQAGFKRRTDGFGVIPFKVTGTAAAPKTDLAARFGKAVAIEAAKEGLLGRLFGKKKQE